MANVTGQRQPVSTQYLVVACATAPVAPTADFANKLAQINQTESSGKQSGSVAIREGSGGALNGMIATGNTNVATWLPMTAGTAITPAVVAAMALGTDLTATMTVAEAADATFTTAVTGGHAPLTYAWFWDGIYIDPAINPSAATAVLVNHAVTPASAGEYKMSVTDAAGLVLHSSTCKLTVTPTP